MAPYDIGNASSFTLFRYTAYSRLRKFCLLLKAVNMIYNKCKPPSPRQKKKMTPQWVRNDSIHSTRKIMECSISGTEYLCCSKTYIIYCEKSLSNLQEC